MKLYNEEQIQLAMRLSHSTDLTYLEIIESLEQIKLPTDDEIQDFLSHQSNEYSLGFKDAFDLIKDKIQGGNK